MALRGEKAIQELGHIHGVHPNLIDGASELFERPGKESDAEQALERQHEEMLKLLGEMTVENQWLKKVLAIVRSRSEAVAPEDPQVSISKQCQILGISRSLVYNKAQPEPPVDEWNW